MSAIGFLDRKRLESTSAGHMPFVVSVETPIEALRSKRATRGGSTDAGNPPVLQSRAGGAADPSRMYRGMHHRLDMACGIVLGVGALIVVVFACRTAGAAAEARR